MSDKIHLTPNQIIWGIRQEMAVTVEDILARRTRLLFLDVEECIRLAKPVAEIMAKELGKDKKWVQEEVKQLKELATTYQVN